MLDSPLEMRYVEPRLQTKTMESERVRYCVERELGFRTYRNAVVFPGVSRKGYGGVVDSAGLCVPNTSVTADCAQLGANPDCIPIDSDESVVYLGMMFGCWGHCITDCLQRFWVFGEGVRGLHPAVRGKKFVYTVTDWRRGLPKSFFDLLDILGVNKDLLTLIEQPTRFKEVVIPDSCFYHNLNSGLLEYTKDYASLIGRLRVPGLVATRKIYFSRRNWAGSQSFGEERFEKMFRTRGYEIVYPELLTFDEQRRLLAETKELVSTEGSLAHNAIFMKRGAKVVIIRKARYLNPYQPVVNEIAGVEPIYIDANLSHLLFVRTRPWIGPFFLYVNSRLASFLGCRPSFPVFTYLRYVMFYLCVKGKAFLRKVKILKTCL